MQKGHKDSTKASDDCPAIKYVCACNLVRLAIFSLISALMLYV